MKKEFMKAKVWLITGCSKGFGRELAKLVPLGISRPIFHTTINGNLFHSLFIRFHVISIYGPLLLLN